MINEFASQGLLLCPKTRRLLSISADGTTAAAPGGPNWQIKNGALDLYGQYTDAPVPTVGTGVFTSAVIEALHFPRSPEILAAVAEAVADTGLTASDWEYSAEIGELADRLQIPRLNPQSDAIGAHTEYNRDVKVTFQRTFIEPVLQPGATLLRSVRIRNDGPTAITSAGQRPLYIAYHWMTSSGTEYVEWEGRRSPLLVELSPGSSLTVICTIQTPLEPGMYRLQFQPVIEGECWVIGDLLTVPVIIHETPPVTLSLFQTSIDYDYAVDHAVGCSLIENHLATMSGSSRSKILEVGGAIHPQANAFTSTCDVVAIDISFAMSQLGQLYFHYVEKDKRGKIAFICCDAHEPPFQDGTFDGVVMFSALHHFSDPKRLLVNLRRVLKPGGFIAVMCEPCVPYPAAEEYLRELKKGINEQCWTVEEHGEVFLSSGLRLISGQIDGNSLKVILG